ncbi:hypothetical protein ES702_06940 [subsurface metagenome]
MPRGDRTGPWGLGPMTGRAAGYCAGYSVPGFMNPIPGFGRGWGRGYGRGFGRGWGRRRGYPAQYPYVPQQYAYPPSGQVPPQQYTYPPYAYPPMYPATAPPQSPEQELVAIEEYKKGLEAEKAGTT